MRITTRDRPLCFGFVGNPGKTLICHVIVFVCWLAACESSRRPWNRSQYMYISTVFVHPDGLRNQITHEGTYPRSYGAELKDARGIEPAFRGAKVRALL